MIVSHTYPSVYQCHRGRANPSKKELKPVYEETKSDENATDMKLSYSTVQLHKVHEQF